MNEKDMRKDRIDKTDPNPDPITGAHGAHPVGTGVGAAAGGAAGVGGAAAAGAAMGTAAGPAGTVAGAAAGAVVGGLAGKGVAEKMNPTDERGSAYASNDQRLGNYIGYEVVDRNDKKIGTLDCLWSDTSGEPAFIGVKTGWLLGKTHVVPCENVHVSESRKRIRLPYDESQVKDAPSYDADAEMTDSVEQDVYRYYGVSAPRVGATHTHTHEAGTRQEPIRKAGERRATPEMATMQLNEEKVKVGKREVEAGGVRLRKIIRKEVVQQPVELEREEIVIERVPASEAHSGRQAAFNEQEVYIPLRREEAVVEKETVLREEVRARKSRQTDRQDVSAEVRREDVEIDKTGEARERDPRRGGPAEEQREREEQPRSMRLHEE